MTKRDLSKLRIDRSQYTLHAKTVSVLRQAILDGEFRPGDRLIERELCELTGVGRSSIREALRQLEAEHLIEYRPHRGPSVTTVTPEDARSIYELRAVVEGLAARLFAERATDEQVANLDRIVKTYERNMKRQDLDAILTTTDEFFEALFEGTQNDLAKYISSILRSRMHYLRTTITHRQSKQQRDEYISTFREIVDAIKLRDADLAAKACQRHVENAAAIALAALQDN